MFIWKLIYFIFITNLYESSCKISDKRLCVDEKCSVPISLAKALLKYASSEPEVLSFSHHQEVKIFSKEAGSNSNLWGAEINGIRGYVPKDFVREYKILNKPTILIDTKINEEPQVPKTSETDVKPDKPLEPFEIIDGTKLFIAPPDKILLQDNAGSSKDLDETTKQGRDQNTNHKPKENGIHTDIDINNNSLTDEFHNSESENGKSNKFGFVTYNLKTDENGLSDLKLPDEKALNVEHTSAEQTYSTEVKSLGIDNSPVEENSSVEDKFSSNTNYLSKDEASDGDNILPIKTSMVEENVDTEEKPVSEGGLEENSSNQSSKLEENINTIDNDILDSENNSSVPSETVNKSDELKLEEDKEAEHLNQNKVMNSEIKTSQSVEEIGSLNEQSDLKVGNKIESEETITASKQSVEEIGSLNEQSVLKVGNKIESEETITASKQNIDESSAENLSPIDSSSENVQHRFPQDPQEINELINKRSSQLTENKVKNSQTEDKVDRSNEQADNDDHNIPPTILPIFPPFHNSFGILTGQDTEANTSEYNNVQDQKEAKDQIEVTEDLQNNPLSFLDNESKENESVEVDELNQQVQILPKANLFQPQNTLIQENELNSINPEHLKNDDFHFENDPERNKKPVDQLQSKTDTANMQEVPINKDVPIPEQGMFADDVSNEKNIVSENEDVYDTEFENTKNEESSGIFSTFMNFFSWSSPSEENSHDSAIDKIDETNLKCDIKNEIVENIDQFSFNLNSNLMVHLVTTFVIFITFLLFYLSVNKHRVESPLVAKINQLEKDLLIVVKEKESLAEKNISDAKVDVTNHEELFELNQRLHEVSVAKGNLELQLNTLKEELEKKDSQIENLEKELETSTEVGLELNRMISEMLDPSVNGNEKLKENMEQFQRQLQEQTEVIKNVTARLKTKEAENVELLLEIEETRKNASSAQQKNQDLIDKITSIEKEKEAQQTALQKEIILYQTNYNELMAKNEVLINEIQILKTKVASSEREIDLKIKECNSLKESFKNINSMKNDNQKLNSILVSASMKAEYEQIKSDLEKYVRELKQSQSEKTVIENMYQSVLQEIEELKMKYQDIDKEKSETDLKLEVLNSYFKKREAELQEEVLKYKSIWDAKEGQATSTTERIKLLQEEIENYKTQNETLKQEILSQEIALKSQISVLEKKAHENWVTARQSERKLEDARQEAAQLRNRLTFRQRNINEEMVQNGLDQNDRTMVSQPSMYSPASPPLFYDNGRDQVTKSPIPGLPPFLPPPPGAPFVPPPVSNLPPGMPLPPPFMPPLPAGFPGDHRPPPLGRMSSPPIKSRYSPDTSAFSPYERGSPSPIYDSEYGSGPYRNYSPYNSEDDRRGYKSPSPVSRTKTRPSKSSLITHNVNRSNESLEKTNTKKPNMV